jgi:hypothetical protein
MGLDSFLADDCGRDPGRNFFARQVQEGATVVFDSAARVAFLDGLRGTCLASAIDRQRDIHTLDSAEALIENCLAQNFTGRQSNRRNEVVFE